ncbi:D-methionine transport system ATP-binding protein [Ruminococcus sp. YE71]|uniref:methionine ABC transporter ATP-binding protein n=1 Tax=unclassified Ruminococcus TaxID=2608920 RepID=UPI00088398FE|nr:MULTISPECIES: ATP-binding cassette domain-containing protein [unclassified Ruminococcus]SDA09265.1 D-methionine transport system ATP-binding protein [Ruminococcus sp. YE78]SFW12814.1 D-methionine transport system ATP-binding protein [Ruminococcus sp. YE71]
MGAYIRIEDLHKTFKNKKEKIEVLRGIDLEINKGEIYGIVGFSGAGKSTLVRCINRLEEPDSGKVWIGDTEITALNKKQLTERRRKIGMIFQQFNLFDSMTVYQNIAYPLTLVKTPKKEIEEKVSKLLELVGLSDKKDAYPGSLSGGQKQRVGIARALANDPDVLLSDEATSALDPVSTLAILDLLEQINDELGVTIIMITHELEAAKRICGKVAVLENGRMIESGTTQDIFLDPKSSTGKIFLEVYKEFRHKSTFAGGEGI